MRSLSALRSLFYLIARLLGDVQAIRRGRVGQRIGRRIAGKLTGRLFRRLFGAWLLLGLGVMPAFAAERIDLFDAKGKRAGYAVIDREAGRVDFYDQWSRRVGYGKVDERGKAERFKLDGTRDVETAVPLPRREKR
ncbi:MAG: hypothetical protein HY953_01305 [Candidatus Rokubacteria bacterium]|nr:hypothetical protein [Candidatus Rokubacteria bacterium]